MSRRPLAFGRLLELTALTSFAVTAPLLDVLGRAPDFFVFRGATPALVLSWAVLVVGAPPLLLWAGEGVVGRVAGPVSRRAAELVVTALLIGLAVLVLVKRATEMRGLALLAAAVVAAAAGVVAVARFTTLRQWVRVAALAAPLSLVAMLLASPTASLVRPGGGRVSALAPKAAHPPVVVIVFDEFPLQSMLRPGGQIDERVFPNFARLAETSTFFRNATSVAARTPLAVSSILTGRVLERDTPPHVSELPENLFTWLSSSHRLKVHESVTALCPREACGGGEGALTKLRRLVMDGARVSKRIVALGNSHEDPAHWVQERVERQRVDELAGAPPSGADAWFMIEHAKENQLPRVSEFLDSIDGEGRPLHFLHVVLPHSPWRYTPAGNAYEPQRFGYRQLEERDGQRWPALVDHQRHLLQAVYTDNVLGDILDRLEAAGLFDRSLVMVMADHGIDFETEPGRNERFVDGDDGDDADDLMWVPLLVKRPAQRTAAVDDRNAMLTDVAPTVADVLGARLPWETDGRSLFGPARPDDRKVWGNTTAEYRTYSGNRYFKGVLDGVMGAFLRPQDGVDGLYRIGPHGGLVFRPLADVRRGPDSGWTASIDQADALASVGFGDEIPALLTGQVEPERAAPRGSTVAVSLNGVIAGVSELFAHEDASRKFAMMVPDRLLRPGENEVELFWVRGGSGGAAVELRPIRLTR